MNAEPDNPETRVEQLAATILRIQGLAEEYPVTVPTHLIDEALDQPEEPSEREPAAPDGPSIRECASDDAAYWPDRQWGNT